MYTLKLTGCQIEKLRELIDKRYYKLIDELHTLKEIDEQIEDEIYCVDECKEECNQENKYDCPHFQQHQEELETDEDDCCCEDCCSCKSEEKELEEKDVYDKIKKYITEKPAFDINIDDENLLDTIFENSVNDKEINESVLGGIYKLPNGEISYDNEPMIITNKNNKILNLFMHVDNRSFSRFRENGKPLYFTGTINDEKNNQKYSILTLKDIEEFQIIIINNNKVRWGYIR